MNVVASFAALADETRWNVLVHLGRHPSSASALAREFPVSRQAINKHLAVLEGAGLVESRMVGRERRYEAVGARLSELGRRLDDVARAWDRRLAALKADAERSPKTEAERSPKAEAERSSKTGAEQS